MANYNDSRLTEVEEQKQTALNNVEQLYGGMIENSDKFYQEQIDASKQWAEQQGKIHQEQTDFAIQQIEQQKAQAQQDYSKEQSAAYVDWKKQSNQYGAEAEKMAAAGLAGTGYSESSQVNMYNAYQNRVATARQAIEQAVLNYNNSITSARLQNNAALAEIAATALQQQLELSLQGFQYKNSLLLQKEETRQNYENIYYQRYLSVLDQINTERALAQQAAARQAAIEEQDQYYNSLYNSIFTLPVNWQSALALGYGPINEAGLYSKLASGEIIMYEQNGQTYFRKLNKTTPHQNSIYENGRIDPMDTLRNLLGL